MEFFNYIRQKLEQLVPIPDSEWDRFVKLFRKRTFKRGEDFVKQGSFSTEFGFIEKGLFRFFYSTPEGSEFNQTFKKENDYILSWSTIFFQEASQFNIQAMEESVLYVADYKEFEPFYQQNQCWSNLGLKIAKTDFTIKAEREKSFLLYDAQKRYQNFLENFPELSKRVSQVHLSSYLGISPETLNRIIKKTKP